MKVSTSITAAAAAFVATAQATHQLTMKVDNSAANGVTTFKDMGGSIAWNVDLEIYDADSDLYSECRDGDYIEMNWHIHVGKPFGGQGVGVECGAMAGSPPVGGHYDPTFACGGATDEVEACESLGRTAEEGFEYPCTPDEYKKNQYSCEVGDYSGKYGALKFKIDKETNTAGVHYGDLDLYGPQLNLIADRSITFHCGAPRVFCGTLTATAPESDDLHDHKMV